MAVNEDAQHDAVLRLECNARTGEYTLTIEYHQSRPPAEHAKIHERLRAKARQWLLASGVKPDLVKVKFEGCLDYSGQWDEDGDLLNGRDLVNEEDHFEEIDKQQQSQEQAEQNQSE